MNKLILSFGLLFFLLFGCNSNSKSPTLTTTYQVVKVVDGDTFWILNHENKREKVRLIGIDAPESRKSQHKEIQYFGKESSNYLKKLIYNESVYIEYDVQTKDKYQRTLAYIYLKDSTFLNEYLVKNGYAKARTYPPNLKYTSVLQEAEKFARKNKLGLWSK